MSWTEDGESCGKSPEILTQPLDLNLERHCALPAADPCAGSLWLHTHNGSWREREKREIRYTYVRDKGAADGGGSGENLAGHHGAMLRKWKERSERTLPVEPDRLRLLKNRDSDYLAILAIFQDYQLPILPKSSLFFRLLLDYQLPISRKVIGNLDYQLLILSNRSGSSSAEAVM